MTRLALLWLAALPCAALAADRFTLESAEVKPGSTIAEAQVYKGFGCEGGNVSPSLKWKNAPAGTKSFAVTVYDPDAPTGSGWWHWVFFNIPASVTSLPSGVGNPASGQTPKGAVQAKTDFGKPGYGGPCPPSGDKPHRYIFTVYALKVDKLDADENATPAMVGFMINANQLGKASFTAIYGRK
ncbi:MAG TPA: YbhB/YbcL family Raf kinase inhibitor-like protein [Casimicrobiaceae bacterium]|nr:YbhB/YbcL family Raf kinase inhibitor-like protein [Casimicrobiaceae bacterium]